MTITASNSSPLIPHSIERLHRPPCEALRLLAVGAHHAEVRRLVARPVVVDELPHSLEDDPPVRAPQSRHLAAVHALPYNHRPPRGSTLVPRLHRPMRPSKEVP